MEQRLNLFLEERVLINNTHYDDSAEAYQQCIDDLAATYKYRPLPKKMNPEHVQAYYQTHVKRAGLDPSQPIYTQTGTLLALGFDRIVVGHYGAFVEFSVPATPLICQLGQEYRYSNQYSVKYYWLTARDGSRCKIYHQQGTVKYADYLVDKYYIGIYEVKQG